MDNNIKEFDEEQFNRLESLRKMTKLNLIDYFRVRRARKQAERLRDCYIKLNPSDIIEVDYSVANDLETSLRFGQLMRDVEKAWKRYSELEHDGCGLSEFAEGFLKQQMNEKGQSGRRRM